MSLRTVFENARDQRTLASGETIFVEGDDGDQMFGVITGKVELRHGDEAIATVGPGETFGETAIVADSSRSLTAVALEPSQVAAINRNTFLFMVHGHWRFGSGAGMTW